MTHLQALADAIGPRNVLRDPPDVAPYAIDWRGAFRGVPLAVLRPGTVEEVSAAVRACAAEGIAVVPAGGRTGLCGGAVVPENGPPAVVLSLERLNRIREVDARDFSLVAEAGCVVQQVQEAAAAVDRLFPLSWGAQGSAQVGGALSTNAGGIRTLRWGNARDLVLGLEVVLPDGRVLNDLRRVRKDNSGYALRHLFLGGEGTLGVITAAALRLVPALKRVETAFAAVPSPDAALSLLSRMLGSGAEVIAFELILRRCMEIVDRYGQRTRMPMPLESPWYVMVEIAAAHPGRAAARHAGGHAGGGDGGRRVLGRRAGGERGAPRRLLAHPRGLPGLRAPGRPRHHHRHRRARLRRAGLSRAGGSRRWPRAGRRGGWWRSATPATATCMSACWRRRACRARTGWRARPARRRW